MVTERETLVRTKEPSFDYFSAKNFTKAETTSPTVDRELTRFKNNYNSSKLNKVYEKYELLENEEIREESKPAQTNIVTNDFNKIIRGQTAFNEIEEKVTYEKTIKDPKIKIDFTTRTKLAICTYALTSILLGFLIIYNAFSIGTMQESINSINENIATEQLRIEQVVKDIGNMTDEDNIINLASDLSFTEIPVDSIINVTLYEKNSLAVYEGQTNWFDAVCEFVNNLFGG